MGPKQRENCLKWAEALRSGKYKQGQYRLRENKEGVDYYYCCCLGVACDLIDNKKWKMEKVLVSSISEEEVTLVTNEAHYYQNKTYRATPPPELFERYYGFDYNTYALAPETLMYETSLIRLNDKGHSFEEIAYLIEEMVARDMGLL